MKKRFDITGMSCAACSARIQDTVSKADGVKKAEVNLLTESMQVEYDESKIAPSDIIEKVVKLGYGASVKGEAAKKELPKEIETKSLKRRFFVSLFLLLPLMYISMGQMLGFYLPKFLLGSENAVSYAFLQFLISIPVIFINRKYYKNGFKALFSRSPNMDSLIAVGSGVSLA